MRLKFLLVLPMIPTDKPVLGVSAFAYLTFNHVGTAVLHFLNCEALRLGHTFTSAFLATRATGVAIKFLFIFSVHFAKKFIFGVIAFPCL